MVKLKALLLCTLLLLFCLTSLIAQDDQIGKKHLPQNIGYSIKLKKSVKLQNIVDSSIKRTLEIFRDNNLKSNEVAVTLIFFNKTDQLTIADHRGEAQIYPASVVKMFYMAALYRQIEDGLVKMTPELERGLKNMIIDSGNESTGYILDVLTKTSSGPELPEKEFNEWSYKRNAVNRYFQSLGYKNISINQKTHCEDAWGVEQQFRGYANKNRNMLTTNATARMMAEIALGKSVNPKSSKAMINLMKRDWEKPVINQFYQEFISHALEPGIKLWSKEGFTSKTRHDVAYIETPDGAKLVLAIFTENHATEQEIIPSIARNIIKILGEIN